MRGQSGLRMSHEGPFFDCGLQHQQPNDRGPSARQQPDWELELGSAAGGADSPQSGKAIGPESPTYVCRLTT